MIDITAPELAEAILEYVMSDEVCEDFCEKRDDAFELGLGGLSMAEYVAGYRLQDFENWARNNGWLH